MTHRQTIRRLLIRHYTDNGATRAYVFWADGSRTEGAFSGDGLGLHMAALFERGRRQGLAVDREVWLRCFNEEDKQ